MKLTRRQFLANLGLVSVPLIVKPSLIFDYGANARHYAAPQTIPFGWYQAVADMPAYSICHLGDAKAYLLDSSNVVFSSPLPVGVALVSVESGEWFKPFTGPGPCRVLTS